MADTDHAEKPATKKDETEKAAESVIEISRGPLRQEKWEELANSDAGQNATTIVINPEYNEHDPPVIDLGSVRLPNLMQLEVNNQAVKALNMTADCYPNLQHLALVSPCASVLQYMDFQLPRLKTIAVQFVEVADPRGFGRSLSRCPKLEVFSSYKLWGLGWQEPHLLVLPKCTNLEFYRSDDLCRLKIWAPRLLHLSLQACYNIDSVNILQNQPAGYKSPEYQTEGQPSPYTVNYVNACRPKGNILTHPRCLDFTPSSDNEDGEEGVVDWFESKLQWKIY